MQPIDDFPNISPNNSRVTSPETPEYNCIAWAANDTDAWWWPDEMGEYYWPASAPREETVGAFVAAYATLGFMPCIDGSLVPGREKLAIFAHGKRPTHAARQLPTGEWTSKLGENVDIEHTSLEAIEGPLYGTAVAFLERTR